MRSKSVLIRPVSVSYSSYNINPINLFKKVNANTINEGV